MDSSLHLEWMTKENDLKWKMMLSGIQEHYGIPDFRFIIMLLMSVLSLIKALECNLVLTFTAFIPLWSTTWCYSIIRKLCLSHDVCKEQLCWQYKHKTKADWWTRELMWHTYAHTQYMHVHTHASPHTDTCTHHKFMKSWKENAYSFFFHYLKITLDQHMKILTFMDNQVIFKCFTVYFQYLYFWQFLPGCTYWPWTIYSSATDTLVARITDPPTHVQIQ